MHFLAVIFDYGEVLSGPPNLERHRELIETSGIAEETFDQLYWTHRLDFDANILNGQTYWQRIAQDAGVRFTSRQIDRLNDSDAAMWMDLNENMLGWAFALQQAGIKTGILSNMGEAVLSRMRQEFAWLPEFDQLTWSCELGIVKPDPTIYRYTVDELEVRAEEALFIDNLEKNVTGAEAAGLHALHFTTVAELAQAISQRGFALPLPAFDMKADAPSRQTAGLTQK